MNDIGPFQRLDDRVAGRPLDQTLHDTVPRWAARTVREWINKVLKNQYSYNLAQRVALRLHLETGTRESYVKIVSERTVDEELHVVVDAILQLHFAWDLRSASAVEALDYQLLELEEILVDMASMFRVDPAARRLVRRVDETVEKAVLSAIESAPEAAAGHLQTAWIAAYGVSPDPDKVFNEAIRAVEEVACPLVESKKAAKDLATLGTVLGELGKNSSHKWELALPGGSGNPRPVGEFVGMMEILWDAQLSRHGGGPKSRRMQQPEAEAAVHLAALLVQWLSAGVLRRKP